MKTAKRIVFSVLTLLVLMFVFGNSLADGENSSELSLMVMQWINSALTAMNIELELTHHAVRKLAHFTEYSVLGCLLTMTAWSWQRVDVQWRFYSVWTVLVSGACIAGLDELLQTFVSGRYGSIADAALDFSGVLWVAAAVSALLMLREKTKNKPDNCQITGGGCNE